MKIRLLILTVLFVLPFGSRAQYPGIPTNRDNFCQDVCPVYAYSFARLMEASKLDSAKFVLDNWVSCCGHIDPTIRAAYLWNLEKRIPVDSMYDSSFLYQLIRYEDRKLIIKSKDYGGNYLRQFDCVPVGQKFDRLCVERAKVLKDQYPAGSLEKHVLSFYAMTDNNDLFTFLQRDSLAATPLAREYAILVQQYKSLAVGYMLFSGGVWIPTGDLSKLGVHPSIGMGFGVKKNKWEMELALYGRFVNAPNAYPVRKKDGSIIQTKHFENIHLNLGVAYDLKSFRRHNLQVLGGLGMEIITSIPSDENDNSKYRASNSYNLNLGLGYEYWFKVGSALRCELRYNAMDMTMSHVIDMKGHAVTFHVSYCLPVFNSIEANLQRIHYQY